MKRDLTPKDFSEIFSLDHNKTKELKEKILLHPEITEHVLKKYSPQKLKIKTLLDCFEAFHRTFVQVKENLQNFEDSIKNLNENKQRVFFEFEDKLWMGSISNQPYTNWKGSKVHMIVINCPNDSYFYTENYKEEDSDLLCANEETKVFIKTIKEKVIKHPNFEIGQDEDAIDMNYYNEEQRITLRFWSKDRNQCISVNFRKGFYEKSQKENKDKWKAFIEQLAIVEN